MDTSVRRPMIGACTAVFGAALLISALVVRPLDAAPSTVDLPITGNAKAVALIEQAIEAADYAENGKADALFKQALRADPSSVTAQFFVGLSDPSVDKANATIKTALAKTAGLPKAERLVLEFFAARFQFDLARELTVAKDLVATVAGSKHAHLFLGDALAITDHNSDARAEYHKAIALDPMFAVAYNSLGHSLLLHEKPLEAIASFRTTAKLRPNVSSAQDSLGEALLEVGKFDDAATAFERAVTIDSKFAFGYQGQGFVKFYTGDKAAAVALFEKYVSVAATPYDRAAALVDLGYINVAAGNTIAAEKAFDDSIAAISNDNYWPILVTALRGEARELMDQHAAALQVLTPLAARIRTLQVPESQRAGLEAQRLYSVVRAQAGLGQVAEATKSAQALAAIAKASPGDKVRADQAATVASAAAIANGDMAAAVKAVTGCNACRYELMIAQQRAGQTAAAAATRKYLTTHFDRNAQGAVRWVKLTK